MPEFHLHIDALSISKRFETYLIREFGFWRSDFCGHPAGSIGYEPPNHFTLKVKNGKEFKALFAKICSYAKTHMAIRGYIEGEFIVRDEEINELPFDVSIKPPFKLRTQFLPPGRFRESEIHISLNRDQSDARLICNLMEMGLFSAYIQKPNRVAQIFTVQGSIEQISVLLPALLDYLKRAGGATDCSIKEERVASWWTSEPALPLPPVISDIDWLR